MEKYRETLAAYWRINSHPHINEIVEILLGETKAYVFFARHYGDLHSYVRARRKLREAEASRLFRQIMEAVACCHENGIILRDLKLRKFVFKDQERLVLIFISLGIDILFAGITNFSFSQSKVKLVYFLRQIQMQIRGFMSVHVSVGYLCI